MSYYFILTKSFFENWSQKSCQITIIFWSAGKWESSWKQHIDLPTSPPMFCLFLKWLALGLFLFVPVKLLMTVPLCFLPLLSLHPPPPLFKLVAAIIFISIGVIASFFCAIVDGIIAAEFIVSFTCICTVGFVWKLFVGVFFTHTC